MVEESEGRPLIAPCTPAPALSYPHGGAGAVQRWEQGAAVLRGALTPTEGALRGPCCPALSYPALPCSASWVGPLHFTQRGSQAAPRQAGGRHASGLHPVVGSYCPVDAATSALCCLALLSGCTLLPSPRACVASCSPGHAILQPLTHPALSKEPLGLFPSHATFVLPSSVCSSLEKPG